MNIEITKKSDGSYWADPIDINGQIPIGNGLTKQEAIGNLIYRMAKEVPPMSSCTWLQKFYNIDINFKEIEEPPHEEIAENLWENKTIHCENWVC